MWERGESEGERLRKTKEQKEREKNNSRKTNKKRERERYEVRRTMNVWRSHLFLN
jgi:hypothetical protein